jgi:prophage DNA circulation protein
MNVVHPDYSKLAARVAVSNLHKMTKTSFREVVEDLYTYKDIVGRPAPMIAEDVYLVVQEHWEAIENAIDFNRDYGYDFFGFKTLERSYLLRLNG